MLKNMYIINVLLFVALFIGSLSFLTGEPGKITLKIGFIKPFFPALCGLADLGKQYLEGFQTALEMFNNDDTLAVDLLGIEKDSGISPSQSCQDIAESFVKSGVVAVIGAYRSICSMKAADILGKLRKLTFRREISTLATLYD